MRFQISATPIRISQLKTTLNNPQAGAFVTFEGWVRNHNEGHSVTALEYEAYEAMALQEGVKIIDEAREKFHILDAQCVHRVGKLSVEDMAVWVGVTAAHRKEAFRACEYIIDEVKHRLPIWKKEYYVNGDSGWVNCEQCTTHHLHHHPEITPEAFYARQLCLPEIGWAGQETLRNSKILVVGAGGLGSPALLYLAAAGVGTIGICDEDTVDVSNLHRQVLFRTKDVGQPKAQAAQRGLLEHNPLVSIYAYDSHLTPENALDLFSNYDLVLDCTDNFAAKFLMNDASVLTETPLVQASIYQYEGQLQILTPGSNTACIRCLWPKMPEPGCVGNCAEVGVFGAVAGVFGTLQAVEALKYLLKLPGALCGDSLITLNLLDYSINRIQKQRDPSCPICGDAPVIKKVESDWYQIPQKDWLVEAHSPELLSNYCLVDIREPQERDLLAMTSLNALEIPLSCFSLASDSRLQEKKDYLLVCSQGIRSAYLARVLREQGHVNFYALKQGIGALSDFKISPMVSA